MTEQVVIPADTLINIIDACDGICPECRAKILENILIHYHRKIEQDFADKKKAVKVDDVDRKRCSWLSAVDRFMLGT